MCPDISGSINRISALCAADNGSYAEGWNAGEVLNMGTVMLCLAVVGSINGFCFDYFGHFVGVDMGNDLRLELFSHLEKLSFSSYDRHRVGELNIAVIILSLVGIFRRRLWLVPGVLSLCISDI